MYKLSLLSCKPFHVAPLGGLRGPNRARLQCWLRRCHELLCSLSLFRSSYSMLVLLMTGISCLNYKMQQQLHRFFRSQVRIMSIQKLKHEVQLPVDGTFTWYFILLSTWHFAAYCRLLPNSRVEQCASCKSAIIISCQRYVEGNRKLFQSPRTLWTYAM